MSEQDFQIALAAVRQQREAAFDAIAQNAVVIAQLQQRVRQLEAQWQAAVRPATPPPEYPSKDDPPPATPPVVNGAAEKSAPGSRNRGASGQRKAPASPREIIPT